MRLEERIEGVLFYRAEPVSKKELFCICDVDHATLAEALTALREHLGTRGVRLAETDEAVELVSAPELDSTIEELRREELSRDIGKAGAETLSIILYREPVTRAEIDHIRGVNSTFILRNLLVRGLIARTQNPKDQRSFYYRITPELLKYLGVTRKQDLPEYETVMAELAQYEREA